MKIPRIYQDLNKYIHPNKALVIYGPRQVGKTTLLKDFLAGYNKKYKLESGDNIRTQQILGSQDFKTITEFVQGYDLIAIHEAQKIPGIGNGLKILVDQVPGLRVIATGSSSFDLSGQVGEPLTGRKTTLTLYPVSQSELGALYSPFELRERIEEWLVFGSYPEVITTDTTAGKSRIAMELSQSYLLKDILELDRIKSSRTLLDLLKLLAFQVGSEVSLSELGRQLGVDYKTVGRYIDLLEKTFVIHGVRGYSGSLRKEITKKCKYYFYDTGIRNALIANFNGLDMRNDAGALWENFLFIERLKKRSYQALFSNIYFWRSWSQQEIDMVEEREGKLFAYEFKWGNKKIKPPGLWKETYPQAGFEVIDRENYLDFVT